MYYLDLCTCIELMRGRLPLTAELMNKSPSSLFAIPSIVVGELLTGVEKSSAVSKTRFMTERFLSPFEVVPFDEACARSYAKIRASLEGKGVKIGPNDLLIAACAMANGAVLVTDNIKEFKRIDGLELECWDEISL